jgi:hypothetical protein
MRRVGRWILSLVLMCACSSAPPAATFSLTDARVDPIHVCAAGSVDASYDVHTTIQARNTTSKDVTIESATADMLLIRVSGKWLERVGDTYDAGSVAVSPSVVPAGATSKLQVTIPSACSSGRYGDAQSSAGSYRVTVHLVTSAGAFHVAAANQHQILAA